MELIDDIRIDAALDFRIFRSQSSFECGFQQEKQSHLLKHQSSLPKLHWSDRLWRSKSEKLFHSHTKFAIFDAMQYHLVCHSSAHFDNSARNAGPTAKCEENDIYLRSEHMSRLRNRQINSSLWLEFTCLPCAFQAIVGPLIIGAIFSHISIVPFCEIRLFENLSFFFIRVTNIFFYTCKGFTVVSIQRAHRREWCAEKSLLQQILWPTSMWRLVFNRT